MTTRPATEADEPVLRELWEEFEREVPPPPEFGETWVEEWEDVRKDIGEGLVLLAEDDDGAVGCIRMRVRAPALHLSFAYVRPRARRRGVLRMLLQEALREARERGAEKLSLHALVSNELALATWRALGFEPAIHYMTQPLDALRQRLESTAGATFGSLHVQTDDRDAVRREVAKYRPRMAGPGEHEVSDPRNGWVSIYDEVIERDRVLLKRYGRELSYAAGAVVVVFWVEQEAVVGYSIYDHGSSVDDYLSVPDFHGPVPPGDIVSLGANPRVVQRLTGADPAVVRAVARTASTPAELPPVRELVAQIAAAMGIVDADRGYS